MTRSQSRSWVLTSNSRISWILQLAEQTAPSAQLQHKDKVWEGEAATWRQVWAEYKFERGPDFDVETKSVFSCFWYSGPKKSLFIQEK